MKLLVKEPNSILVYRAASAVEAHSLVAHLADEGIDARVLGESLQGAYSGIKLGGMDLPEVWIADRDRVTAEPVIAAWRALHFPARDANKTDRFQFPLSLMFVGMTYAALLFGLAAMSEQVRSIFAPVINLLLFAALAIVAWKRVRARRPCSEES